VNSENGWFSRSRANQLPKEHIDWLVNPVTHFVKIESAAGVVLFITAVATIVLANSPLSDTFEGMWQISVGINLGDFSLERSLHQWINDAVMTLFFFLISLELKRELVLGELRESKQAMLSVFAALGGMAVPAAIYLILQFGEPGEYGWGTVMATDTAFVMGCLALLGKGVPKSLRIFMLTLAIVDDVGAIMVVAIGYSEGLNWFAVSYALLGFAVIKVMSFVGIRSITLFFMVGAMIWLAVDASGIHATLTGVILGLMTPTQKWVNENRLHAIMDVVITATPGGHQGANLVARHALKTAEAAAREALSPVERLEMLLHPWVGFVVLPVFAFANAGVSFSWETIVPSLTLAIFLGFVVGKPLGILLFTYAAVKLRIAALPHDLQWSMVMGGGMLAGIGFTMALFIANLAFEPGQIESAKLGIFCASIVCALMGMTCIRYYTNAKPKGNHIIYKPNDNRPLNLSATSFSRKKEQNTKELVGSLQLKYEGFRRE
jgi:NhaA family Na+:H+ antiporter